MTYMEFKTELRELYPTITIQTIRELYKLECPDTVADTPPPQPCCVEVTNQEEGQKMFDECTLKPQGFKIKRAAVIAPMASAQVISSVPVEATQRDYAIERIKAIGDKHAQALRVQFNMDTLSPKTFLELEALVKAGDYTVSDLAKSEDAHYYSVFYGVHFGKPKDEAGYDAAKEVLKAAFQKALDGATLKTIDVLESVIEDFEDWTL